MENIFKRCVDNIPEHGLECGAMDTFKAILNSYGGIDAVKDSFGYTDVAAVYNWKYRGIPASKLIDVHFQTGIAIDRLRQLRQEYKKPLEQ